MLAPPGGDAANTRHGEQTVRTAERHRPISGLMRTGGVLVAAGWLGLALVSAAPASAAPTRPAPRCLPRRGERHAGAAARRHAPGLGGERLRAARRRHRDPQQGAGSRQGSGRDGRPDQHRRGRVRLAYVAGGPLRRHGLGVARTTRARSGTVRDDRPHHPGRGEGPGRHRCPRRCRRRQRWVRVLCRVEGGRHGVGLGGQRRRSARERHHHQLRGTGPGQGPRRRGSGRGWCGRLSRPRAEGGRDDLGLGRQLRRADRQRHHGGRRAPHAGQGGRWGSMLTSMVAIAAGETHSMALRSDGTVWAWGYNGYGQLGDGTTDTRTTRTRSRTSAARRARSASAAPTPSRSVRTAPCTPGATTAMASSGTARPSVELVEVRGINRGSGVSGVLGGRYHSVAVRSDGQIRSWGDEYGFRPARRRYGLREQRTESLLSTCPAPVCRP